jgi:hypothetical protein
LNVSHFCHLGRYGWILFIIFWMNSSSTNSVTVIFSPCFPGSHGIPGFPGSHGSPCFHLGHDGRNGFNGSIKAFTNNQKSSDDKSLTVIIGPCFPGSHGSQGSPGSQSFHGAQFFPGFQSSPSFPGFPGSHGSQGSPGFPSSQSFHGFPGSPGFQSVPLGQEGITNSQVSIH